MNETYRTAVEGWLQFRMASQLGDAQRRDAASAIAYRCAQLCGIAELMLAPQPPWIIDWLNSPKLLPLQNAAAESALAQARALAYFIKGTPSANGTLSADNLTLWHFTSTPPHIEPELAELAGRTIGAVSTHHSHSPAPQASSAPIHPGPWPIVDLAVALTHPVVEMLTALEDADLFDPSPASSLHELLSTLGGQLPPIHEFDMPDHQQASDVALLAVAARQYLDNRPRLLER